ncbi:MAG: hypothetical protein BWX73_03047 [Lentisphaerae bacterium ADurb.Bin082]|nr:MAG: hypothetical protein BWX73_03047 [Lentisphaerae bacterium ADurb.Bin082]
MKLLFPISMLVAALGLAAVLTFQILEMKALFIL